LGLSQVKKIIDLHQGTIDITSEKDKGTTVLVTLPVESEKARLAVPLNK
jgi:signal transduction histidine kinase